MAALQRPSMATATASACIPETARGTHVFTVAGYRLHKGLGAGNFIRSSTFTVGGYDWCIRYYPDRYTSDTKRYVAVYVELQSKKSVIPVPPSDLSNNLAKLLEGKKGADVVIKVRRETFYAHKIVLAMRSPVFDTELYGPMWDEEKQCLQIADMEPDVFRALLHFIYTDSLPAMDDDNNKVIRHLLVAADRYAMGRMKLMCESILCKSLDAKSVVATLALADQYHCTKLREACIDYIKLFN
ncbi:hypothetical protein VPH35_032592 [Triticum aestivum]